MPSDEIYANREQTQVKHYILRHYLKRFAHIVGSHWSSITYIDGFAGPWNVRSPEFADSSFGIALAELREARETHRHRGRSVQLRCCFLEQSAEAYNQLHEFADRIPDAEVTVINNSFEDSVPSILRFIRASNQTFPFLFIDPTGWTGFKLNTISPLLKLDPGEVLINFMTSHIRRFLTETHSQQSFAELFGSSRFRDRIAGLSGIDLDDAIVAEYISNLKRVGNFGYVLPAIILHPEIDRMHFHLIYATRHPKGVEVFKDAEKRAMEEMERVRAEAQRRRREERTGQREFLFPTASAAGSSYYNSLRERYLGQARENVRSRMRDRRRILYDDVWSLALSSPLVWESDLKGWINEWQRSGEIRIEGLQGRQRVPGREQLHFLIWQT